MSTVEIDPPPQALRLVSSQGERTTRDRRYRHAASLGFAGRQLHRDVLQFALSTGRTIDADALRVVLATKQTHDPGDARRVTAAGVWQLLFVDVVTWCRNRRLPTPDGVSAAVESLIDYLEATQTFAAGSDSPAALRGAFDECTGGWDLTDPTPERSTRRSRSVRSARGQEHP